MNWSEKKSFSSKLVYRIATPVKFSYSFFYNDQVQQFYNHLFKLNPDGRRRFLNQGTSHIVKLNHTLSARLFYDVAFAFLTQEYRAFTFEDPFDFRYENDRKLLSPRVVAS